MGGGTLLKSAWNVCLSFWLFFLSLSFFVGHGIPLHCILARDRERKGVCVCVRERERKREATLNLMGRQWVMNYSLSKSQHWCYHRGCQCTGMTAVTANPPQKRFSTDKWYFLIIHLPGPLRCPSAPQPLYAHKMLFLFLFLSLNLYLFKWARCC